MRCLKLFDGYRIVATPMAWVVQKVTEKPGKKDEVKFIASCADLDDAINSAIRRDIRITPEVHDINGQIKAIGKFVREVIGEAVTVKSLFEEVAYASEKDEGDPLDFLGEEEEADPLDFLK